MAFVTHWVKCAEVGTPDRSRTCRERSASIAFCRFMAARPATAKHGKPVPLEVAYALPEISASSIRDSLPGLWKWAPLLPAIREKSRVSLREGRTPLLPLHCDRDRLNLLLKNETANPTWSWKDRANCVSVSMAVEFGFPATTAISTGNPGCAAAAYSDAAGQNCVIFCHTERAGLAARAYDFVRSQGDSRR